MHHSHTVWWITWIAIVILLLVFFESRWKKKTILEKDVSADQRM